MLFNAVKAEDAVFDLFSGNGAAAANGLTKGNGMIPTISSLNVY